MSHIINRIGEITTNNQNLKMIIIKYNNANDVDIKFEDGHIIKNVKYCHFKNGCIKNPYNPEVCGVGYIGDGEYKVIKNGKITKTYATWRHMLQRCYDSKFQEKHPSYKGCTVCNEWLNFQNFAKWYEKNYYEIDDKKMCLDKDILVKGNKVYSPETCVFVPDDINSLFTKRNVDRGKFPIGVSFHKSSNKYIVNCNINGKLKNLGYFKTTVDAFNKYKEAKEKEIKRVADKYKYKIPEKLYNALYSYKVEIDD